MKADVLIYDGERLVKTIKPIEIALYPREVVCGSGHTAPLFDVLE